MTLHPLLIAKIHFRATIRRVDLLDQLCHIWQGKETMTDKFILTPYFLDDPVPGLRPLAQSDWLVNETELPSGNRQTRMVALYRPLATAVSHTLQQGNRPISIAGDCCTSIGVLAGLQQAGITPTLIWLDAHGDFNTWETTPSGFLGGMPLAMIVGRGEQTITQGTGLRVLPEHRIILTDARDLDPGEREAVTESAVIRLPDVRQLLNYPLPAGPLYVHFDTDVINPTEAPAMNYPTPGGPSVATLAEVFQRLAETERIVAVSVSTWNPDLDKDGRSRQATMTLLQTLLG
ncbi:MAG: hypothetical protein D6706_19895 [Chloroflexi bacterium]|nr:MAG: hypothetical protein D6706_19895 [Chloroflexota bacterium]